MPDTTTLPMAEGGRASGGKTNWPVMIGVGGAGVLLLVLLMSSQKSSGSGTTAAGTSVNAALGSIQEENLNLMGQLSQASGSLSGQVADVGASVQTSNSQLSNELNHVSGGVIALSGQVGSAAQQQNQYYNGLMGALAGMTDAEKTQFANLRSVVVAGDQGLGSQLRSVDFQTAGNAALGMAQTTATTSPLGSKDPRVLEWLQRAQNMFAKASGQPLPYPSVG